MAERWLAVFGKGEGVQCRRALLLYAAVLMLLFFDILFLGRTLDPYPFVPGIGGMPRQEKSGPSFCNDPGAVVWAFQPWNELVHHSLFQEHEIPLWNPYQGTGVPLAANFQSGVFSPMQWPFFLSTSRFWWDILFVLRLLPAGLFTFLFLRRLGLSFVCAWFGGLAYMLCGYHVDYINMNHLAVPLVLPAALYFAESWRVGCRPGHFVGTVFTLSLLVLAGMPESTFLAGLLTGCFLMFQLISERRPWTEWLPWPWILLLVLMLSAVLLLPGIEYAQLSHSKHFSVDWGTLRFPREAVITFLVPFFFGPPGSFAWNAGLDKAFSAPSSLGVATVVLAATGLFCSRHRLRWFFGGCAVLITLKLFGPGTVQEIGHLPLLRWMIFTKYLQPSLAFCTAVLASLGLDAVVGRRSRSGTVVMTAGAAGILMIAAWLFVYGTEIIHAPQRVVALSVLLCAAFGTGVGLLAVSCGWLLRRGYRHGATAILLLASVEILALSFRIHPDRLPSVAPPAFVERLSQEAKAFRSMGDYPLFPDTASGVQIPDLRVLDPILPGRMVSAFSRLVGVPIQSRLTFRELDDYESPALDLLGVRYIVSSQDVRNLLLRSRPQTGEDRRWIEDRTGDNIALIELEPPSGLDFNLPSQCRSVSILVQAERSAALRLLGSGGVLGTWTVSPGFHALGPEPVAALPARSPMRLEVDSTGSLEVAVTAEPSTVAAALVPLNVATAEAWIFERPTALPIAFLTDSARLLEAVASPDRIPGFGRTAEETGDRRTGPLTSLARRDGENYVALVRLTANRLEFEVEADRPGHLFVSTTWFPGWSASVDDRPVEIERAAFFMSALPVPAGSSRIVLSYAPLSVRLGLALSMFGVVLTIWAARWKFLRAPPGRCAANRGPSADRREDSGPD